VHGLSFILLVHGEKNNVLLYFHLGYIVDLTPKQFFDPSTWGA